MLDTLVFQILLFIDVVAIVLTLEWRMSHICDARGHALSVVVARIYGGRKWLQTRSVSGTQVLR